MRSCRHPLHCLSLAIFALLALVLLAVAGAVQAADLSVTGGTSASNDVPATYGTMSISGTNPAGDRSTYTANAPLTANWVSLSNSGVFSANAPVTASVLYADASSTYSLNSATTSINNAYFYGPQSLQRTGGNYAFGSLSLNGGDITYGAGDSVTRGIGLSAGAVFRLDRNLSVGSIALRSSSSSLVTNGYGYATDFVDLGDTSSLIYRPADTITRTVQVGWGSQFTLERDLTLTETLSLGSAGALVRNGHAINVGSLGLTGGSLTLGPGDGVTRSLGVSWGTITLDRDLTLSGDLNLRGSNALVRSGQAVSAATLRLEDGATFTYRSGDSLSTFVTVSGYSGPALTLEKDLSLTSSLSLQGPVALVRNGHSYSAADLSLTGGQSLTYEAGDSVTNSIGVSNGSQFTLNRDLAVYTLGVGGENALVTNGHSYAVQYLTLSGNATLSYRPGDSISQGVAVYDGSSLVLERDISLESGSYLSVSGTNGLVRNGHHYSVGSLSLEAGASLSYDAADSITSDVQLWSGGATLVANKPLSLDSSLYVADTTTLVLNSFDGTGGIEGWGLRVRGDYRPQLDYYLSTNLIQTNVRPELLAVTYDATGTTTYLSRIADCEFTGDTSLDGVFLTIGGSASGGFSLVSGSLGVGRVEIGKQVDGIGVATVSGGVLRATEFMLGVEGSGSLHVSGGRVLVGQVDYQGLGIGVSPGSAGSLTITGGTVASSDLVGIGAYTGTGSVVIDGGMLVSKRGQVGQNHPGLYDGEGTVTVTSGTWLNSGTMELNRTGSIAVSGSGAITTGGLASYGSVSIGDGGTLTVDGDFTRDAYFSALDLASGGTLRIGTGGTTGSLQGDIVNNGTLVFDRATSSTYSGIITGTGALVKQGAGRLTLTGTSGSPGEITLDRSTTVLEGQLWSGTSGRTRLRIGNTGTGSLLIAGGTMSSGETRLGSTASGVGSATVASGSWNSSQLTVGWGGGGSLLVDGGVLQTGEVRIGWDVGGTGVATIKSGAWIANVLNVGAWGTGTLAISGGAVTTGYLGIGDYTDSGLGSAHLSAGSIASGEIRVGTSGEFTMSGGLLDAQYGYVYGKGIATLAGGTVTTDYLFVETDGGGRLAISGAAVASDFVVVGTSFAHSLATVSGGRLDVGGNLQVGYAPLTWTQDDFGTATVSVTGGVVTVSGTLDVRENGTITLGPGGTLQIGTGGTTGVLSTDLTIGGTLAFSRSDEWSHGLTISGSGSVVKLGAGILTLAGTNSYSGGTQVTAGTLRAANTSSFGTGTIVLSSGATLDLANLTFANSIVNNGGTIINGAGYDGTQAVTSGTATITGTTAGTVVVDAPNATAEIAGTVTGTVTASNGGTVVITGSVAPTAQVSVGAGSTVSIGNGAAIAQPTLTNAGKFAVTNTTGSVALPTAISGTGSFEKTGGGSVQLTGSSSFTGGSTIASGEVVVQNTKALGSGGVTVSSGGRLLVDGIDLDLGGAAVALVTGAELKTTSGARVTVAENSDLSGVRSSSPAAATAAILAGTAVSGTLATTWTTTADPAVKSEVLELKTPTSASNPFVLSLSYAVGLDPTGLFLGWNDPVSGAWVNAVVGNELVDGMNAASGSQLGYLGSFAAFQAFYGTNLDSYLGAYGRDNTSRTVWAVVNHNSEFAVTQINPVPEPGTWALALMGLAGVAVSLRRNHARPARRHS